MNAYTFLAIHNTVLCAMTAAAVYVTESLWAMLPLVFISTAVTAKVQPKEVAK